MKVIFVMVMSLDGKTTKWGRPKIHEWTSPEDQAFFLSLIEKNRVIIMGRKTFLAAKLMMKFSLGKLRLVMTHSPKKYKNISIPGQLEFTNDPPGKMIKELRKKGYKQVLLVGGEQTNTVFFKEKLINEVWVTIEPMIFGFGNGLVGDKKQNISLKLKSVEKLNRQGTLLLKYKVL